MENTESILQPADAPQPSGLLISNDATQYWPALRNWSLFCGIMALVGAGFIALFLVLMTVAIPNILRADASFATGVLMYVIWFVIALVVGILLILFSNSIGSAVRYPHHDTVRKSAGRWLAYLRLAGVISMLAVLVQCILLLSLSANMP